MLVPGDLFWLACYRILATTHRHTHIDWALISSVLGHQWYHYVNIFVLHFFQYFILSVFFCTMVLLQVLFYCNLVDPCPPVSVLENSISSWPGFLFLLTVPTRESPSIPTSRNSSCCIPASGILGGSSAFLFDYFKFSILFGEWLAWGSINGGTHSFCWAVHCPWVLSGLPH